MGSTILPRKCTTLSSHFTAAFMAFLIMNCLGDAEAKEKVKIVKSPPPNITLYVRSTLQLTWQFKEVQNNTLRRVRWGIMNDKGEWKKTIYIYSVNKNPPEITLNPNVKELKDRVSLDETTFTFEMRDLSLADTGYYGCEFDVGMYEAFIRRSVFVKVVDVELLLPPKGKTTTSLMSWMDHKAKMTCEFHTEGPIDIAWELRLRNGTKVEAVGQKRNGPSQSTLTMVTSREQDFQTYICTGRSKSTTVSHNIPVKRLYEPSRPLQFKSNPVRYNNKNTLRLVWKAPRENGGTPIQHYVIFKRVAGSGKFIQVKSTQFRLIYITISKEDEKRDFYLIVRAKNRVGLGPPSAERRIPILDNEGIVKGIYNGERNSATRNWNLLFTWIVLAYHLW